MTTPDPITTARQSALELRQIACLLNDDQAQVSANFDREAAITSALDYAEKLQSALSVTQEEGRTEIARLEAEVEKLKAERDALKREAEQWAMECKAHKSTVHEIYQVITGATGEPGNWNGSEPVKAEITRLTSQLDIYKSALGEPVTYGVFDKTGKLRFVSDNEHDAHMGLILSTRDPDEFDVETMVKPLYASQWIKDRQATGGAS